MCVVSVEVEDGGEGEWFAVAEVQIVAARIEDGQIGCVEGVVAGGPDPDPPESGLDDDGLFGPGGRRQRPRRVEELVEGSRGRGRERVVLCAYRGIREFV